MEYAEIDITVAQESRDAVMNRLSEMGSLGVIETDSGLLAYFEQSRAAAEICREMEGFRAVLEASGLDSGFKMTCSMLPDRDWNEEWKKGFTPIDVGENLSIVPSWLEHETTRTPIIIDPGMVFGTGHHETTRTCLSLIEKISKSSRKESLLDIGTGTGILAVGAARLGFRKVVAVDIDPLCVDAAIRNSKANGLENIDVKAGDVSAVDGTFDVIVANLLSEILTEIAPSLASRLRPDGTAILSGLLTGQEDNVIEAMTSAGLGLQEKIADGKWVSLVMKNG